MLGHAKSLDFPRLVRTERLILTHKSDHEEKGRKMALWAYKLDWASFDERRCQRHEAWRQECWPNHDIPFEPALPPEYEKMVDEAVFGIKPHYMDEIVRHAQMARSEWSWCAGRGFDTLIRDWTLSPAIAHARVAFELLNDCLISEDKTWWSRGWWGRDVIVLSAMLLRLWKGQTGGGLLRERALINEREALLNNWATRHGGTADPEAAAYRKFIAEVDAVHEARREAWQRRHGEIADGVKP